MHETNAVVLMQRSYISQSEKIDYEIATNIVPVTAKYSLTFDNQNGQIISILYWFYTETLNELETIPRPIYYIISLSFFQGVSVATAL